MKLNSIITKILKKTGIKKLTSKNPVLPKRIIFPTAMDDWSFENEDSIFSGEFFPSSENILLENLLLQKSNVQPHEIGEPAVMVCHNYPDWWFIEEAKKNGVRLLVADTVEKPSKTFGRSYLFHCSELGKS